LAPSAVVTVIVELPVATDVTTPLDETVATAVLLLNQVTLILVAVVGIKIAVRVPVSPPDIKLKVVGLTLTPVTAKGFTVTAQIADFPLAVVAVILAVPGFPEVTRPESDTLTTVASLDNQFTD
jgi:hypothetical protein